MNVADFRYWEETKDTEREGVEACRWAQCQGRRNGEVLLLTGDNAPSVTKGSPMPQCENRERPPKHNRAGQNLPKGQFPICDPGRRILTGITLDSGPDSLQERYYPECRKF